MRPRGTCVRMKRPLLDMEELARSLPGGQGPQHGLQALLRHVISYIEFLQKRIRDTQNMLVPNSSQLGFRPLWTPRHSLSCTGRTENWHLTAQKRCQPVACAESPEPDSEPGMGQKLVPYVSSSSSENGDPGPWMVSVAVSPQPPLSPSTPQSTVPPFLGLSPSLQSSPVDDVTVGGLVPPVLFEEVQICGSSPLQESSVAFTLCLDHSYQLQNGSSTGTPRSATSNQQDGCHWEKRRPETSAGRGLKKRQPGSVTNSRARSKARGRAGKAPAFSHPLSAPTSGEPRKTPDCGQKPMRKKCVNGFIMFCRLNRRPYLRANPGTASTAATRHLAELWRTMSVQERRPYCMKALHFSLVHDRLVKHAVMPQDEASPPTPPSLLLVEESPPSPGPPPPY